MVKVVKKSSSTKASQKALVTKRVAATKTAPTTLLEVLEARTLVGKQVAAAMKPSEDGVISAKVHKTIKDVFKDFSSKQIDELIVDGMTLRQTMIHDRMKAVPGQKFGKIYNYQL